MLQEKPQALDAQVAVALETLVVQWVPHALQLLTSSVSLTHAPLQFESPDGQPVTHVAPEQLGVPPEHVWPQDPQLFLSVCSFTHALPQALYPLLHVKPHAPPEQVALPLVTPAHRVPHPWQFCGSVCSLTQVPPQRLWPAGQPDTHCAGPPPSAAAAEHTGVPASALQVTPQNPQLVAVSSGTHALPHIWYPALHDVVQPLLTHAGCPFGSVVVQT